MAGRRCSKKLSRHIKETTVRNGARAVKSNIKTTRRSRSRDEKRRSEEVAVNEIWLKKRL